MSSQVDTRLCISDGCGRELFGPVSFCPYCGCKQQIPKDRSEVRESGLETSSAAGLITRTHHDADDVSATLKVISKTASDIQHDGDFVPQLAPPIAIETPVATEIATPPPTPSETPPATTTATIAAITTPTPDPKHGSRKAVVAVLVIGAVALVWAVFTPSSPGPGRVSSASKSPAAAGSKPIKKLADESTFNARKNLVENALNYSATGDITAMDRALQELAEYSKSARGDRSLARRLNREGLELLKEKHYIDAATKLREAITADPRDEEIRNNLGFALIYTDNLNDAQRALVDTLTIAPKRANGWMNLGMLYGKRSLEAKAVGAYIMAHRFSTAPEKAIASLVKLASDPQEANQVAKESARKALERITGKELATLLSDQGSPPLSARPAEPAQPKKDLRADTPSRPHIPSATSVRPPVSNESDSPSPARRAFESARESAASPEPAPAPAPNAQILALIKQAEASLARKQYSRARAIAESVLMLDPSNADAIVVQQRAKDAQDNALKNIKIE